VDDDLARLWQWADGRTQAELEALAVFEAEPFIAEELAALRMAGLLLPPFPVVARVGPHVPNPGPLVSVVIVSRNGWHHLCECLPSLAAQTYPHVEIILVDDQSTDQTAAHIRDHFPTVKIVNQTNGPNFAAGCNLGIRHAAGELVFLLNNDTVLDPFCIAELVAAQTEHTNVGGVGAMLRFHDNRAFINSMGTYTPPRALGYDLAIGTLNVGQFDAMTPTPLLCFGAALLPIAALAQVGPIDEAYQFYYEDADWSYRARAKGLDLLVAPHAIVYHKFSASMAQLPSAFKTRLSRRNRLRYALKNFPAAEARQRLAAYASDDILHLVAALQRRQAGMALAYIRAWLEFAIGAPLAFLQRQQRRMANRPVDLAALARPFPAPELQGTYPRLTQWLVSERYRSYLAPTEDPGLPRLLIISPDTVDESMGGVGVRYWELARVMSEHAQVTLAVPNRTALTCNRLLIYTYEQGRSETLRPLVHGADVILLSGFTIYHHPFLRTVTSYMVIDLYDPTVLENLERFGARPIGEQHRLHQLGVVTTNELLLLGDFFICASEKQRDFWLGALTSANRVNPDSYVADPSLRRLIDVVPFGLPNDSPRHTKHVLKGVFPGIREDDKVIIWGGGLWDWLDPISAINAMPVVLRKVPQARLFFLGTKHPNPDVPPSSMAHRAIERAAELGLKDRAIFFNEWVPYAERADYLLEADVGLSLHGDHIETRFSVRTRLMDYLWASLPMVISGGDTLSDLIAAQGLGQVVPPGDVNAVAAALVDLLNTPLARERFATVARLYYWSAVAEPLKHYIAEPWRNGDRRTVPVPVAAGPETPCRELRSKAVSALRERGPNGLMRDVRSYLIWRFGQK
jgi:GT2 family glycosyltransferase/glycosyltransferase involved in cell wall biosynthesis